MSTDNPTEMKTATENLANANRVYISAVQRERTVRLFMDALTTDLMFTNDKIALEVNRLVSGTSSQKLNAQAYINEYKRTAQEIGERLRVQEDDLNQAQNEREIAEQSRDTAEKVWSNMDKKYPAKGEARTPPTLNLLDRSNTSKQAVKK